MQAFFKKIKNDISDQNQDQSIFQIDEFDEIVNEIDVQTITLEDKLTSTTSINEVLVRSYQIDNGSPRIKETYEDHSNDKIKVQQAGRKYK